MKTQTYSNNRRNGLTRGRKAVMAVHPLQLFGEIDYLFLYCGKTATGKRLNKVCTASAMLFRLRN